MRTSPRSIVVVIIVHVLFIYHSSLKSCSRISCHTIVFDIQINNALGCQKVNTVARKKMGFLAQGAWFLQWAWQTTLMVVATTLVAVACLKMANRLMRVANHAVGVANNTMGVANHTTSHTPLANTELRANSTSLDIPYFCQEVR